MIQDFGSDRKIYFPGVCFIHLGKTGKNQMFITNVGIVNDWEYTKSGK